MKTIVVVEDQAVLASAYRNKFAGEGFKVEVALDGEIGFDLITRIKPDLVLLDMHLPKLDGLELLKKIRANPDLRTLPIIILSNLTKPGAVEAAWQAGATLVLSKLNTSPKRVLEAVHTTLAANASIVAEIRSTDDAAVISLMPQANNAQSARGKILLVEDHSDLNTLLTFLLQRAGHQVTNLKVSGEALQQIGEQSFDLFVLGRNFSDGTELSLCKQLRQARPAQPIVVYSTTALFSEQQEGLKAGATAYLTKAEDLFNIGEIVSDLINSHARLAPQRIRAA